VQKDFNPPLFYIVMSAWRALTNAFPGPEEAWFRLPSVLADLALLYLVYRWTTRNTGPVLALYAAIFLAFFPLEIEAARTARPYTLFALWTFVTFSALIEATRMERTPPPRLILRIVAGLTLALYTHYFGWILLLAAGAFLIQHRRNKLILWLVVPVLLYLPWIPIFIGHLWRGNPMIAGLTVYRLVRAGAALLMGQTVFLRSEGLDLLTVALTGTLFAFVVVLVFRALAFSPSGLAVTIYWALMWLIWTPVFVALFVRSFEEFYLVFALPFLALLLASGTVFLRGFRPLLLFLLLLFLGGVYPQYSYEHQGWRDLAVSVSRKIKPGDVVAYNIWFDIYPARHYLKKILGAVPPELGVTEETFSAERMEALTASCHRIILIGSYDRELEQKRLRLWLIHNRGQADIQLFQHTFLEIYPCSAQSLSPREGKGIFPEASG